MTDNPALKMYHPAVVAVLRFFEFEHLPEGPIKLEAQRFAHFAYAMADDYAALNDPELTWSLRQLLAAKDAAVRCAVLKVKAATGKTVIVNPSEFGPGPLVAKPMASDREFREGPC